MPTWLRWLLVLPAAVMSYVGIQILVGIQSETLSFPDWLQDLWSQGMNSIVGPWAFVFVGARVAPPRRAFETSVTLAVIFGIFTGVVGVLALLHPSHVRSPWWLGLTAVLGIVIVIATCFQFRDKPQLAGRKANVYRT
jgi:hypothetical protein